MAIEYDVPASYMADLPRLKGVEFQWLSRVPSVGEYIKLTLLESAFPDVVLVYPVQRVTHYAFSTPPEKDVPVAVVSLHL